MESLTEVLNEAVEVIRKRQHDMYQEMTHPARCFAERSKAFEEYEKLHALGNRLDWFACRMGDGRIKIMVRGHE